MVAKQIERDNVTKWVYSVSLSIRNSTNKLHDEFNNILAPNRWHHIRDRCRITSFENHHMYVIVDRWLVVTHMG